MLRALLPLRSVWGPYVLQFALICSLLFTRSYVWFLVGGLIVYEIARNLLSSERRKLVLLCFYAIRCRTYQGRGFSLHLSPRLVEKFCVSDLQHVCQHEFDDVKCWFGFAPSSSVSIYLFEGFSECNRYTTVPDSASSDVGLRFVVMPVISESQDRMVLRHELAHHFSYCLGSPFPLLKSEGLAVWLEYGRGPIPLERQGLDYLKAIGGLTAILDTITFCRPENRSTHYQIAGSFAEFLVDQFGKSGYLSFYEHSQENTFTEVLETLSSMRLAELETLWTKKRLQK